MLVDCKVALLELREPLEVQKASAYKIRQLRLELYNLEYWFSFGALH